MTACRHLVIMAKAPEAGRAKRRLAREVGAAEATRVYRVLLAQTLRRLARDPRWRTWHARTPDVAARCSPARGEGKRARLPPIFIPQGPGDLGDRMQRLMDRLPPGPVVIVGSDIPDLRAEDVAAAFRALGTHDVVLGPAADGGYWLVGQSRVPKTLRLFGRVRWSGPHALADTLRNAEGHSVALLRVLSDLDDHSDYRAWRLRLLPSP